MKQNIAADMADSGFLHKLDPRFSKAVHEIRSMEMETYVLPPPVEMSPPLSPPPLPPPSPPLPPPPLLAPPALSEPFFIFDDIPVSPFLIWPFNQFGVTPFISSLVQLPDNEFEVEAMGASLIVQSAEFSQFFISNLDNDIPGNIKLSFFIVIASGDPQFLALRLNNQVVPANGFDFGTPLAFLDDDDNSDTLPLQEWIQIEVRTGAGRAELGSPCGLFYKILMRVVSPFPYDSYDGYSVRQHWILLSWAWANPVCSRRNILPDTSRGKHEWHGNGD